METEKTLRELLKREYGIRTAKDLVLAMRKQKLDMSMFCGKGDILNGKSCVSQTERVAV